METTAPKTSGLCSRTMTDKREVMNSISLLLRSETLKNNKVVRNHGHATDKKIEDAPLKHSGSA